MTKGQIIRRTLGGLLLVIVIGLTTCQALWAAWERPPGSTEITAPSGETS